MVFYNFIVNSNNSLNFSSNLVSEFQDTDVQNSNIPTLNLSSQSVHHNVIAICLMEVF